MLNHIQEKPQRAQIKAQQEFLMELPMDHIAFKDLWTPKDIWLDTGFSGRDGEFLTEITKLILWIEDIYGTKNEFLCHGCNFNIHSNFS